VGYFVSPFFLFFSPIKYVLLFRPFPFFRSGKRAVRSFFATVSTAHFVAHFAVEQAGTYTNIFVVGGRLRNLIFNTYQVYKT